jgi:hypothetical protein
LTDKPDAKDCELESLDSRRAAAKKKKKKKIIKKIVKKKRSDGTYTTEITKTTMKRDGSCSIVREIMRYDSLEH